ncbi:MAG: family N-acetyltransferase [Myxococcales bacterium]|nr:family N-acetyltransferase [Myxococcales bacterium]
MHVHSLALKTELGLAATRGRIVDRGDYVVVETPDDPGYYYGNLLVLPAPPQVGEVAFWTRRFEEELGANPAIRHVTFWWDGITGDPGAADELRAAGFRIEKSLVMTAEAVAARPHTLEVRPLAPDEVPGTADLAWIVGDRHDESYRAFLDRRAAWHQRLVTRGLATFWGAFDADALVASLGLVPLGTVARYQDVQTAPDHRRLGLASALLASSSRAAFEAGVEHVVIIADPDNKSAQVYERAGFRVVEKTASACRYPA